MSSTSHSTTSSGTNSSSIIHDSRAHKENIAESFTKKNQTTDLTYDGKFVGKDRVSHGNIIGNSEGMMIITL